MYKSSNSLAHYLVSTDWLFSKITAEHCYCHVLMVVTVDEVGLTTGFIGFLFSYTQLQCTHYSRPSHKATLHSLQWQWLLSLCSTALSWLSLSRAQDLLQTRLFFSHWPSTNWLGLSSGLTATTSSQSESESHITTDDQSVSASWFRAPSGAHDQMLITVWLLLWREVGSVICLSHLVPIVACLAITK
jgi:hypothetical protein